MNVKISTMVQESVWKDFKRLAKGNHQSISHLLTEAIQDYLRRKRVRPEFLKHMEDSIKDHEKLGQFLAK